MCVMIGAMEAAASLRNLEGILSRPVALCGCSALSLLNTLAVDTVASLKSFLRTPRFR